MQARTSRTSSRSRPLRYDAEDRENTNIVPGGPAAPLGFVRTASFERLQPRVSLRYEASDQLTAYATYGEGFRSGGFNPLGSRAAIINVDGVDRADEATVQLDPNARLEK